MNEGLSSVIIYEAKEVKKEYKIMPIIVRANLDEVKTSNIFFENNQDSGCDNSDDFKRVLNDKYPAFKEAFLTAVRESTVESGVHYEFEDKFSEYFVENSYMAIKLLERTLREFYENKKIVKAILHIVSHYTYEQLGEDFVFPVVSLLNYNDDKGIRKFALKVFDNWDSVDTLGVLRGSQAMREGWLNEYKERIISRLERKKTNVILFTCD